MRFLAETCLQFSPQIACGDHWVFVEIGACLKIYSESHFLNELHKVLEQFKINARVEIANDLPTALASAIFKVRRKEHFPIEAIPYYFNPYLYDKQFEKIVSIFRDLGITNFKKLDEIPPGLLTSKFNKNLNLVMRQIDDARNIYWPRFAPEETITETYEFEETQAISNLEPLAFVLKGLLERICSRLLGQHLMIAKFEIKLVQEMYSTVLEPVRVQSIDLAYPHNSVPGLLGIIRERLEKELTTKPLESNVIRVSLKVLEKAPGGYRQKDLFSQKEEDREAIQSLISRVKDKLGETRIFYAQPLESFFPEKSWCKSLNDPTPTSVAIAPRPLRVLMKPLKLCRIDHYFTCNSKRWKATNISEPERLSGDWWLKEEGRKYFTVKTDSNEELWIYSPDDTEEYFLHGIYD